MKIYVKNHPELLGIRERFRFSSWVERKTFIGIEVDTGKCWWLYAGDEPPPPPDDRWDTEDPSVEMEQLRRFLKEKYPETLI